MPPPPIKAVMGFAASLRRRLACERGFTLIELLVASLVMVIMLIAIANVGDAGQVVAARDGELALAVSESQPGLDRMVRELRQAVAINPTGTGAGQCASRANCVDINVAGRLPSRTPYRVRYACLSTSCVRYVSTNIAVPATAQGTPLVARVLNSATTSATPIFRYRKKDGTELAASDALTAARTIDVSIQVPAKGDRKTGYVHNIFLQDGAHLKNVDVETTP